MREKRRELKEEALTIGSGERGCAAAGLGVGWRGD